MFLSSACLSRLSRSFAAIDPSDPRLYQTHDFPVVFAIIELVVLAVFFSVMWKLFTIAGRSGWLAFVPIYNQIVLLQIARRPLWWFILLCIPVVGLIVFIVLCVDVLKRFGRIRSRPLPRSSPSTDQHVDPY